MLQGRHTAMSAPLSASSFTMGALFCRQAECSRVARVVGLGKIVIKGERKKCEQRLFEMGLNLRRDLICGEKVINL